jgi:hypothetical protein
LYIVYGAYMGDTTQFEKARNMLRIIVDVSLSIATCLSTLSDC